MSKYVDRILYLYKWLAEVNHRIQFKIMVIGWVHQYMRQFIRAYHSRPTLCLLDVSNNTEIMLGLQLEIWSGTRSWHPQVMLIMIDLCCRTCNKSISGNFIFKLEQCLILSSLEQISIKCTWCQLAFSVWSQHWETPQAPQIEIGRERSGFYKGIRLRIGVRQTV